MNWQRILETFQCVVQTDTMISAGRIPVIGANISGGFGGHNLYIEMGLSQKSQMTHTETQGLFQAMVNCVVCVPVNTGTARANKVASSIASLFSVRIPRRAVFNSSSGETVFIRKVEQLAGMTVDDIYKTNVRISIDVYVTEQ